MERIMADIATWLEIIKEEVESVCEQFEIATGLRVESVIIDRKTIYPPLNGKTFEYLATVISEGGHHV
jgi:hypothetical protein